MLAGKPTAKPDAKSVEASAIAPIGRTGADMILASPSKASMFMRIRIQNDTNRAIPRCFRRILLTPRGKPKRRARRLKALGFEKEA
jgi:hypothetical protein